jgi:hypothetical protein
MKLIKSSLVKLIFGFHFGWSRKEVVVWRESVGFERGGRKLET